MIKLKDVLPEVSQEIKDALAGYKDGCQKRIDQFKESSYKRRNKMVKIYQSLKNLPDSYFFNLSQQVDNFEVYALHCDDDQCASFFVQPPEKTSNGHPVGEGKDKVYFLGLAHASSQHLLTGIFLQDQKILSVEYHLYENLRKVLLENKIPVFITHKGK